MNEKRAKNFDTFIKTRFHEVIVFTLKIGDIEANITAGMRYSFFELSRPQMMETSLKVEFCS